MSFAYSLPTLRKLSLFRKFKFLGAYFVLFSLSLLLTTSVLAQTSSPLDSLMDLSIEELLSISLVSRELAGIHHTHPQGEWMLSYSHREMRMAGNLDGSSKMSIDDVLNTGFKVVPTTMTMKMDMFGVMYGLTDKLTLMAMLPYKNVSMQHVTAGGHEFTARASGLGDARNGWL